MTGSALEAVPGVDLAIYEQTLLERFASPVMRDALARLATDASDRIPKFILPVVHHQLKSGGSAPVSAAVVAAWARCAELLVSHEAATTIHLSDRRADAIRTAAKQSIAEPLGFLRAREIFGELAEDRRFTDDYVTALKTLRREGARVFLKQLSVAPQLAPGVVR